jgi:hypothetical protein
MMSLTWAITTVDKSRMIARGGGTKGQVTQRGEFLRNPDGSITWLRLGGRIRARQG